VGGKLGGRVEAVGLSVESEVVGLHGGLEVF
jgi:hypothetical protein